MDECYMCHKLCLDDIAYKCIYCHANICLCSHCYYTAVLPNYKLRRARNGSIYKLVRCCYCKTPTIEEYEYD